jgi:Clustered mitochondria
VQPKTAASQLNEKEASEKAWRRRSTFDFDGTDDELSDLEVGNNSHSVANDLECEHELTGSESPARKHENLSELKARARANSAAWTVHNWNSEFQEVMTFGHELYCDSQPITVRLARYGRLSEISRNFTHAAETYAKIIISELCLPRSQKSIQPSDAGGVAGGLKYVVQGIFFKFVVDTKIRSGPDYWMYGGSEGPNDEAAVKAAGNELVGAITVWSQYVDDLHSPMMSIIDYQGFRVLAISVLPLSKDTLQYGSNDGGKTMHRDNKRLAELIESVTEKIGLSKHCVGSSGVEISGPGRCAHTQ